MMLRRGEIMGEAEGWKPAGDLDHFMQCPICGGTIDCRDLGQVMDHLHGQDVEMLDSAAPGS